MLEVPIDTFISIEESSRKFVPANENWLAISVDEFKDCVKYLLMYIKVYTSSDEYITSKAFGFLDKNRIVTIVAASGVTHNDLVYASKSQSDVKVINTTTVGHKEAVYKNKYICTPYNGYWDSAGLPIILWKYHNKIKG